MPHLFVDITSHGLGHLAQVAPILNVLAQRLPALRLSVRSALPHERLAARIDLPFEHIVAASDFGFAMVDALRIDHAVTMDKYREAHRDWPRRVAEEAAWLHRLGPDFVLTDVAYRPLASAAAAGIPAAAVSSLNWADLFAYFYAGQCWAAPILDEIRAAYASAPFLQLAPAMPMDWLPEIVRCGPVAKRGQSRRLALEAKLGLPSGTRLVLVGLGGFAGRLPVERWADHPQAGAIHWLVPQAWGLEHPRCTAFEPLGYSYVDLLASADAAVAKPGYGTFAEAACNGAPLAFVRREAWPEEPYLIEWLAAHGRAAELTPAVLATAGVAEVLHALWRQPAMPPVEPDGAATAAAWIEARLGAKA